MSILLKYYFKNTVKRKKETIGLPALRGGKTPQKLLLEGKKKNLRRAPERFQIWVQG